MELVDENVTKDREKYVGGSDVPAILGISKYKTQFELAKEKVGILPRDFEGNEYTEYGHAMEPKIRDFINESYGLDFQPLSISNEVLKIRSNVDGFDEKSGLLEVKTHGKNPDKRVYIAQMQLYMWHLDCLEGQLAMYEREEDFNEEFDFMKLEIEKVEADPIYQEKILHAIQLFWERCEYLRENPNITEAEFLSYGEGNQVMVLANQVYELEQRLVDFKKLEEQYKSLKLKLYKAMEENEVKKFETDQLIITRVLPSTTESFDSTKFKKAHSDLAKAFTTIKPKEGSIRIKVKGAEL